MRGSELILVISMTPFDLGLNEQLGSQFAVFGNIATVRNLAVFFGAQNDAARNRIFDLVFNDNAFAVKVLLAALFSLITLTRPDSGAIRE
jgi:hypothetical protein